MMTIWKDRPKVSVCVMTYNQVRYIRQCLQSILVQRTNFDFDIIVGDDASTDGTTDIVREFSSRYPGKIKTVLHNKNMGPAQNYFSVHNIATGDYIAHVDGDDYCLPGKLQAQAHLLDSDPSCNIVFHRMLVIKPTSEIKEGALLDVENIGEMKFDRGALIQYMAIGAHSSKMYRKAVREFALPDFDVLDYFVNVEQVGNGVARFAGYENYGVYRSGIGIATGGPRTRQILAKCFVYLCKKYPEYRLQVNTAALVYFIADLKNGRKTWPMFFVVWIKTFHIGSLANLLRSLKFINSLRY